MALMGKVLKDLVTKSMILLDRARHLDFGIYEAVRAF